jgi:ABC-type molybdate transport system substrate-binding protein
MANRRLKAFAYHPQRPRPGYLLVIAMVILLVVIVGMMGSLDKFAHNLASSMAGGKITVYAAVELQPALEEMAEAFTQETGTRVKLYFGDGPDLIHQIQTQPDSVDLLLAPEEIWTEPGPAAQLIAEVLPVARLPKPDADDQRVSMAVLQTTEVPQLALKFARYVHAYDRGGLVLRRFGIVPSNGDPWAEAPKLTFYADLLLSQAVEPTVSEFCRREGIEIERIYRHAGALIQRMQDGALPDVYCSSSRSLMGAVAEPFEAEVLVSQISLLIVTQAGNPKAFTNLASLSRAGLRIGLAHPQKTALGQLTQQALEANQLGQALQASGNLQPLALTGDALMAAMVAGKLDAAVVFASHVVKHPGPWVALPVAAPSTSNWQPWAVQAVVISKKTPYSHLAQRLVQALRDAKTEQRFKDLGYQWILNQG